MNKKMLVMTGIMLVSGASVSLFAKKYDVKDLITAAQKGKESSIGRILRGGVDVDSRDRYGYTALHYAAQRNNEELARYLVSKGASINATTRDGQTALDLAPVGTHTHRYLKGAGGKHSSAAPEIQERTRQPYSQVARKSSVPRSGESWEKYEARMRRQYRDIPRGALGQKRMKYYPLPEARPEGWEDDDSEVTERRMVPYTRQ